MAFGNIGIRTREGEGFYCALARFISSYYLRVIVVSWFLNELGNLWDMWKNNSNNNNRRYINRKINNLNNEMEKNS